MYIRYLIATLLVELGKGLIQEGIDIAGKGSLEIDFEVQAGTGYELFKATFYGMIIIPTVWVFLVILFAATN